jgi:hypothetical protein
VAPFDRKGWHCLTEIANMFNLKFTEMKKLAYLLVLMFSLVLVTSCEKDETIDPVTEQTSGEKYPEYVGYWQNDLTTFDGKPYGGDFQFEFDIHDVKAEERRKTMPEFIIYNDTWRIEDNNLIFWSVDFGTSSWIIESAPKNGKLILKVVDYTGVTALYYLSKR